MSPEELLGRAREKFAREKDVDFRTVVVEEKERVATLNEVRETCLEQLEQICINFSEPDNYFGVSKLIPLQGLSGPVGGKNKQFYAEILVKRHTNTRAFDSAEIRYYGDKLPREGDNSLGEYKTISGETVSAVSLGGEQVPSALDASTFSFPHTQEYADRLRAITETIEWIRTDYPEAVDIPS